MKIWFNLLPAQQKKHLHTQKVLRMIMEQEIYLAITLGFFVACLFGMYIILKTEATITKNVEKDLMGHMGYKEVVDIQGQFKDVHKKMAQLEEMEKKQFHWSRILILMSESMVDGVRVEEYSSADNRFQMRAVAQTRDQVVMIKEKFRNAQLSGVTCFENITVPESDLAAPKDVVFTMSFDINLMCLQ